MILLIYSLRNQKSCFTIKVRYTPWLLGAKMSVLRNEPFATENIFRETCLFSVCLVAYDPYWAWLYSFEMKEHVLWPLGAKLVQNCLHCVELQEEIMSPVKFRVKVSFTFVQYRLEGWLYAIIHYLYKVLIKVSTTHKPLLLRELFQVRPGRDYSS